MTLGQDCAAMPVAHFVVLLILLLPMYWKMLLSLSWGMQGASKGEEGGSGCQVVED